MKLGRRNLLFVIVPVLASLSFLLSVMVLHQSEVFYSVEPVADEVPPVYSDDPDDPWNRIFKLLFATPVEWTETVEHGEPVALALVVGQTGEERLRALHDYYTTRYLSESVPRTREHAEDLPDFFYFGDVKFLLEDLRFEELTSAIAAELQRPTTEQRTTIARVLFQQDLWNWFNRVQVATHSEEAIVAARAETLLDLLGSLIAEIALPLDKLQNILGNFPAVAEAYDALDPSLFAGSSTWNELVPIVNGNPHMMHTRTAWGRRVFRSFLRVPGKNISRLCVHANLNRRSSDRWTEPDSDQPCELWSGFRPPDGSRVLLLETLVAIAANGERVALPTVLSIEMREIGPIEPGEDRRYGLDDIAVSVFHASRRSLIANIGGGGLVRIDPGTPVPIGLGAFGGVRGGALEPLSLTCRRCHGLDGRNLMTGALHSRNEVQVLHPDNTIQADSVTGIAGRTAARIDAYFPRP